MNLISIRKAKKIDIKDIVRIHKRCVLKTNAKVYAQKTIQEWLGQISVKNILWQFKNTKWFVIKINNKIVGFCQLSLREKSLYQINIDPRYQNKGYGKILYNFIEKYFKKNKIKTIFLNTTINAQLFYKNLGFKKIKSTEFKLDKTY
ncbi:GNAT family N-acetyltransferase, partial [Patescibacteria group bacterium]|nr:GNAT family N-acetyltransferase [Patescibacteria group bacterium]